MAKILSSIKRSLLFVLGFTLCQADIPSNKTASPQKMIKIELKTPLNEKDKSFKIRQHNPQQEKSQSTEFTSNNSSKALLSERVLLSRNDPNIKKQHYLSYNSGARTNLLDTNLK